MWAHSALDCIQAVIMLLVHSPFASVKTQQIIRPVKITYVLEMTVVKRIHVNLELKKV
jgi:hypothetical protein